MLYVRLVRAHKHTRQVCQDRKYEASDLVPVLIPETNGTKCRLLTIMSASLLLIKPPCTSVLQLAELLCEFNP